MPDDSFKEFVLDQLGALPELHARMALFQRKQKGRPVEPDALVK
jgi:hypothetical protein